MAKQALAIGKNELSSKEEKDIFLKEFHKYMLELERAMVKEIEANPGHITQNWNYDVVANDQIKALIYKMDRVRQEHNDVWNRRGNCDISINKLLVISMYSMFAYFRANAEMNNFNEAWEKSYPVKQIKIFDRFADLDHPTG